MGKTARLIAIQIYATPAQKMQLDRICKSKKCSQSSLLRHVLDNYLKYMDKAFMHPAEEDVHVQLKKIEDRLVKLQIKHMLGSAQMLYMICQFWKVGAKQNGLQKEDYHSLLEKSENFSVDWVKGRHQGSEEKAS